MYLLPDATVLCNFAAVDELPLLVEYLGHKGRMVEAVDYEVFRSSRHLPALLQLDRVSVFGDPITIDADDDVRIVENIRTQVFGGLRSQPLKHLGESQSIHVVSTFPQYRGSVWITDDHEAHSYGRGRGITVRDSVDVACALVARGERTATQMFKVLQDMLQAERTLLRNPTHHKDLTT